MVKKNQRQFIIKQIIQEERIENQEKLLKRLHQRGFKTTQATLSRDLHKMGIIRVPTQEGYRYVIAEEEGGHSFRKLVGMEILSILHNESMVVVKTITGRAQGVALFIDQLKNPYILATLAGENAVLVIPDSVSRITQIEDDLKKIASGG
ncbi:MAG: arginine repressor [bacterium]|nr:MAG: arginine repressor [bacterium]